MIDKVRKLFGYCKCPSCGKWHNQQVDDKKFGRIELCGECFRNMLIKSILKWQKEYYRDLVAKEPDYLV